MRKTLKILKKMFLIVISILLILVIGVIVFVNTSPQFGGSSTAAQKKSYAKSVNYKDGKFINKGEVAFDMSFSDFRKIMSNYASPKPNTIPNKNIETNPLDSLDLVNFNDGTRVVWFGHSTFLIQINNVNILVDPMFGNSPSPLEFLGTKRFSKHLPIAIEMLPEIDLVLISHDHYDHLDYNSINKLKHKVKTFYTPLGVGSHLEAWGVKRDNIVEHDWWEKSEFRGINFICTPAQHFSGRGIADKNKTLWSSWVIKSETENIFFSGDSGYADHFKEIGNQFGPFDLAMVECGQYNELWPVIHMFPEETVKAGLDLKAKKTMPIHWGAFKLSTHSWKDPIERFLHAANEVDLAVVVPKIGVPFSIHDTTQINQAWWHTYE